MLDEMEERLKQLEETVGIGDDKPTDLSLAELKDTLSKKGFNHIFKVDVQKLKKLKEFMEKSDSRPLSEKITFVQCCAEITRKRAELLEEFESRLKVVLNTDDLTGIEKYEKQLEPIAKDIDVALQQWKKNTVTIEEFRKEYTVVMGSLEEYIQQLATQVEQLEAKKKKAASDD